MSGVGVTGLLANLPGTATPYPTQDPALELGGFRSVADNTARDAIAANFRTVGMIVVTRSTNIAWQLVGGILNANWKQAFNGEAGPAFPLTQYQRYVIPGLPVDSFPYFGTIQAAINDAANTSNLAQIYLPWLGAFTENLTFPDGGAFEFFSPDPHNRASITGTVTGAVGGVVGQQVLFTNITIIGAVSFSGTGAFSFLQFYTCRVAGTITAASYNVNFLGNAVGHSASTTTNYATPYVQPDSELAGNVTCGLLALYNTWISGAARTVSCTVFELNNSFVGCTSLAVTATFSNLLNSVTRIAIAFTGSVRADDFSAGFLLAKGCTVSGSLSLLNESVTKGPTAFAANVGATAVAPAGTPVAGWYEIKASIVITAFATAGAAAAFNVTFTDAAGAATVAVFTFDATANARAQGSYSFRSTGVANITFSITGITTPGALAATYEIALKKLDSQVI